MDVRWKRKLLRRGRRRGEDPGHTLSAVLVENQRVDGRPCQRYVKHLGAIHERYAEAPGHAGGFWETADAALASIVLPEPERQAIEARLAERVPRPTEERWRRAWAE